MFNRNAFYLLLCCKNLPVPQIENSVNNIALSHFIQWHRDVFSVLFGSCCCCYLSRIFCIRWLHFNRNKPPLWRFFSLWSLKSMEYAVRVDLAFNWIPVIGAQTVHFVGNQTNCTSLSLSPHLNASFSDVELFLLVAEIHPTVISFLQWLCLFILNISSTIEQYQHLSIGQEQIRFGFKVDFFFFRFPRLLRFSIQIPYHVNRTRNDVK